MTMQEQVVARLVDQELFEQREFETATTNGDVTRRTATELVVEDAEDGAKKIVRNDKFEVDFGMEFEVRVPLYIVAQDGTHEEL